MVCTEGHGGESENLPLILLKHRQKRSRPKIQKVSPAVQKKPAASGTLNLSRALAILQLHKNAAWEYLLIDDNPDRFIFRELLKERLLSC